MCLYAAEGRLPVVTGKRSTAAHADTYILLVFSFSAGVVFLSSSNTAALVNDLKIDPRRRRNFLPGPSFPWGAPLLAPLRSAGHMSRPAVWGGEGG